MLLGFVPLEASNVQKALAYVEKLLAGFIRSNMCVEYGMDQSLLGLRSCMGKIVLKIIANQMSTIAQNLYATDKDNAKFHDFLEDFKSTVEYFVTHIDDEDIIGWIGAVEGWSKVKISEFE